MRKHLVTALVAGVALSLVATVGVMAATTTTVMRAGNSLNVSCPNGLSNTNVKAKSETVNCAKTTQPPLTTTTVSTQPSGGNCTNPSFSSSDPEDTDNTDPNDGEYYWVNNDAWSGSHGPQTIYVCNQSSWYAVSNQPNNDGQVETYPDTEYDVGGRDNPSTTPISSFGSATSTFAENYPAAGGWDAAYDMWTDNWTNETMIWNQWAGSNAYWPAQATIKLTLDGVPYTFLPNCSGPATAANETNCEYMFFRQTQVSSGSVDLLAAFQWEVAHGYAKSDIPTQLQYGVEISYTSGTETFPTTGLTMSVQP
jgi:hypothetical protein